MSVGPRLGARRKASALKTTPPRRMLKVSWRRQRTREWAIVRELVAFAIPMIWEALRASLAARGWITPKQGTESERLKRHGARLRDRLVKLGPTFIKTGQMLATRADLLPLEFLKELEQLHDRVPPFPDQAAFRMVEESLGKPLGAVFSEISERPIAAASLGQVYKARLRQNGHIVALKVRRPNLERQVAVDMLVLERIARWVENLERKAHKYPWLSLLRGDWVASVHEFNRVLHEEMDYLREAESAIRFKKNFADWKEIHVPTIYKEFSTERVLVMEFIEGFKVTDLDGLRDAGYSPRHLNERLYRTYFKQLFEDGFFHADPHPGNLLVMNDGRLAFFDFGMSGAIDEDLQSKIVTAFFHLLERDIDGLIDDLFALDFLPQGADITGLHDVVAEAFERRLDVRLADVKFRELVYDMAPVVYKYPFTTPARFTFLIRALMTLEGISVQMNPDFNFFDVAGPYARDFLFKKESKYLRGQIVESLVDTSSGWFNWARVVRIARAAYELYTSRQ